MAKKAHQNLFDYVVDGKNEVYQSLQNDFDKDTWRQAGWRALFWICAIGGTTSTGHSEWLWIFGALYAVERSISRFIDNSNRNWTMHVIDWMEHQHNSSHRSEQSEISLHE